jgi:hypothetical protein
MEVEVTLSLFLPRGATLGSPDETTLFNLAGSVPHKGAARSLDMASLWIAALLSHIVGAAMLRRQYAWAVGGESERL